MSMLSTVGLMVAAGAALVGEAPYAVPAKQAKAEILWVKPICIEEGRYIGWPTVCKRKNGELLAVFSGDRSAHVCPYGKVQMVRSSDGGETWSAPQTVRNGAMDDRDAGIMELADGTLVLTWFSTYEFANMGIESHNRHFNKIPHDVLCRDTGYFTMRSTDGGTTWEKPPVKTMGSANHGGIQLKSGRLMMVGRLRRCSDVVPWDTSDKRLQYGKHVLLVEVSDDGAKSWQVLTQINPQPPFVLTEFHEPHLVELDDGTIVAQFRYEKAPMRTLQCESKDGGKTWTPMHETGIRGFPPHLLKLRDGRLLCTYGDRAPGHYGEWASLSADGGKTWDTANEICLARNTSEDLGYPSTVQLDDGTLVSVYYQQPKDEGAFVVKPCLMATKWRLK